MKKIPTQKAEPKSDRDFVSAYVNDMVELAGKAETLGLTGVIEAWYEGGYDEGYAGLNEPIDGLDDGDAEVIVNFLFDGFGGGGDGSGPYGGTIGYNVATREVAELGEWHKETVHVDKANPWE